MMSSNTVLFSSSASAAFGTIAAFDAFMTKDVPRIVQMCVSLSEMPTATVVSTGNGHGSRMEKGLGLRNVAEDKGKFSARSCRR
jgi:hypothetical protein